MELKPLIALATAGSGEAIEEWLHRITAPHCYLTLSELIYSYAAILPMLLKKNGFFEDRTIEQAIRKEAARRAPWLKLELIKKSIIDEKDSAAIKLLALIVWRRSDRETIFNWAKEKKLPVSEYWNKPQTPEQMYFK